jgi:cytochrome c-type biogenesis protein CcmH/NrfF
MSLFIDTLYLWIILAVVVVIGFILNFMKKRKYYRRWEEEDKLQSKDFDYGDPAKPEETEDDDDKPWA